MLQKMQWVRGAAVSAALASAVVLGGCGGSSSNNNNAPVAVYEFGQANFSDNTANRGQHPDTNTLGNSAASVAISDSGIVYIADTNNNRVLGFNALSSLSAGKADFVIGQADFTSNTNTSVLNKPRKVSVSGTKLLIVDTGNNRVLVYNTLPSGTGAITPTPSAIIGKSTTAADGSPAADTLYFPTGATFAGTNLIVADNGNNRVLIYTSVTTGAAATYVLGQRNFTSGPLTPNCPADTVAVPDCTTSFAVTADSMNSPADAWSDGSSLVVSDQANNRVLYWALVPTRNEQPATRVIGQTSLKNQSGFGSSSSTLRQPNGVWSDRNTGYIYVADSGNNRVLAFNTPSADGQGAVAVYGQGDYTHAAANDDNQDGTVDRDSNGRVVASNRTLYNPLGMATFGSASTANQVYIVDSGNARLMVYNTY